jgi:hypothetical protein
MATGPNAAKKDVVASIGSAITDATHEGGLADRIAAAEVKPGSDPSGGGGSGSGSGGGGGGLGSGGSPGGAPAAGGSSLAPIKGLSYTGGGGSLSMMGGHGLNKGKSSTKDDANPFGKLFKDGNKTGVVDYGRNPASQRLGSKSDNLFDMISKRYNNVNSEKLLIEYEMAK